MRMVDNKEISIRQRAKDIGMSHEGLRKRINLLRKEDKEAVKKYNETLKVKPSTNKRVSIVDREIKKELPIRKIPTAKEYSGLEYFKLDIEQLRMFYRLLTGRVDKSKNGKASNIKSLINAIIEGLKFNLDNHNKGVND